ncbi:MAG: hypothetical protein ACKVOB_09645 [Sphingomonas sp.]
MASRNDASTVLTIKAAFAGEGDPGMESSAYLFDREGGLIAHAPLQKGQALLKIDRTPRGARLLLGPTLEKTERASPPSFGTMQRLRAFEAPVKLVPGQNSVDIGKIPQEIWHHWLLCRCRVTGHVLVRRTSANGVTVEAPVCNARVHICEVDWLPWIILRLPDPDIFRLRDDLIHAIRQPIPWPPEPDPGPLRDIAVLPGVLRGKAAALSSAIIANGIGQVALNPQPLPPAERMAISRRPLAPGSPVAFNPQPDPPADGLRALPQAVQFALRSNSSSIVRRALLDHVDLIRPWICLWPWLHRWFYHCDELRVVLTDDQGKFDTTIWYPCNGDHPDLYFWVEYSIGGSWTPVYRPPIPCHVWWNYPCGTDVTITVTDPRVPGCGYRPDVMGKQVVLKTIGREVSMGEIAREPSPLDPAADPAKAGLVKPGWIHGTRGSPFGATVEPRVDFGNGLKPAGITHYRWSYRALGSVLESDWIAIHADVLRHYREIPAGPMAPTVYKSARVGPDLTIAGGYYFEIDPALPAGGDDWEVLDEGYDLASAYLDTTGLLGKYELKLELFRVTGGVATRVDFTADGIGLNQVVDAAPLTGSTYTATAATEDRLLRDPGTNHIVGYRLVIHVDNRTCFGTIDSVVVAPGNNDTKCGFLEYSPGASATLTFRASHPANFASFDFNVSRVATPLPAASAGGLVDDIAPNGYARLGDQFSKPLTITALLNEALPPGDMPCERAAFGESLHVYALATNGYTRLSGLDAPNAVPPGQISLRAFAITPAPPAL